MPVIAIGEPGFEYDQEGGGEGFSLQLSGDSTARLNEIGDDVARLLASVEGLQDVRTDAEVGEQEVQVTVDRTRAAAVGMTSKEIADAIGIARDAIHVVPMIAVGDRPGQHKVSEEENLILFLPSNI